MGGKILTVGGVQYAVVDLTPEQGLFTDLTISNADVYPADRGLVWERLGGRHPLPAGFDPDRPPETLCELRGRDPERYWAIVTQGVLFH